MAVGPPPASQPPTRARIVVVEDDAAFQDLLGFCCTYVGIRQHDHPHLGYRRMQRGGAS